LAALAVAAKGDARRFPLIVEQDPVYQAMMLDRQLGAIQRRLQFAGLPMVVLPVRVLE